MAICVSASDLRLYHVHSAFRSILSAFQALLLLPAWRMHDCVVRPASMWCGEVCRLQSGCLLIYCRSRQQTELGKIVNLMSADVNHVMQFFYPFFNQLFSAPALLIASLILLYFQIRYASALYAMGSNACIAAVAHQSAL